MSALILPSMLSFLYINKKKRKKEILKIFLCAFASFRKRVKNILALPDIEWKEFVM